MAQQVFVFGSACVPAVAEALRLPEAGAPQVVQGYRAVAAAQGLGAALVADVNASVTGVLVTLPETAPARVVWDALGATALQLEIGGRAVTAFSAPLEDSAATGAAAGAATGTAETWVAELWAAHWAALYSRAAADILDLATRHSPAQLRVSRGQILVRAASWVRAQSAAAPMQARFGLTVRDVQSHDRQRPYLDYFMLEEDRVRFAQFTGGRSSEVSRAAFVMGDAVTVLPYDPMRDRVLVVEQFRFGPFVRGDTRPWSLEPIAGRIDPGEAPETAARREAVEETGLAVGALEPVANYYVSPGAVTEYLYTYVGLADLPDSAAGIGGLEAEAEDIRAQVLSFEALMGLLASGEAQNGPLILTALWLQANRDRLRRVYAQP